jgi:hypothetical protein
LPQKLPDVNGSAAMMCRWSAKLTFSEARMPKSWPSEMVAGVNATELTEGMASNASPRGR